MKSFGTRITAVAAAVAIAGCGGSKSSGGGGGGTVVVPTTPTAIQTTASTAGRDAAQSITASLSAVSAMESMSALQAQFGNLLTQLGVSGVTLPFARAPQRSALVAEKPAIRLRTLRAALAGDPSAASTASDEVTQYLQNRVFTSANVESQTATEVVYLLKGDDVCPYVATDGSTSLMQLSGTTLDADCAQKVDAVVLRIKATQPAADAVTLALLVGPDRAAPLSLELAPKSAAVVVDLGGVKGTLVRIHTFDAEAPVPTVATGVVDAKFEILNQVGAEYDVKISSTVRQAIAVEVTDASGTVKLATAAKAPLASLQVNGIGADKSVTATLDVGQTSLTAPRDTATSPATTVALAGLSGTLSVHDGANQPLAFTNVGLGDAASSVTVGSNKVFEINLNPRRFGVTLTPSPAGTAMAIVFDAKVVATTYLNEGSEPLLTDKTFTWTAEASSGKPQLIAYQTSPGSTALKVANGTFTVASAGMTPVSANAGQCFNDTGATSPATLTAALSAGACP